jgi:hypothetical protein
MKKIKITKEQFDKITNLLKEGFPKLKKNIVDNTFKKGFAGKEIKNLGEVSTDFNIKKNVTVKGVPTSKLSKFGKTLVPKPPIHESTSNGDLKQETLELIKNLYSYSEFWSENGLSYDEIYGELESKGLIIKKDGKYSISRDLGSAEEAKQTIENELSQMISGGEQDSEVTGELDEEEGQQQLSFAVVVFNEEIAILEGSDGEYYSFYYHPFIDDIFNKEITGGELQQEPVGDETDNDIDYEYGDYERTNEAIKNYVNKNIGELSVGEGIKGWHDGMNINKFDEDLKNWVLSIKYDPNQEENIDFLAFLRKMKFNEEPLNEMHGEDEEAFIQRKMGQGLSQTTAKALYDTQKTSRDQDTARFDARDLANDVATQKADQSTDQSTIDRLKSKIVPIKEPVKEPVGQYRLFDKGIDEMSLGGGATNTGGRGFDYTTKLSAKPIKKEMPIVTNVPVVFEGLAKKPNAFKETQLNNGGFVKFNDCVDLNNKPAGSGCSSGAIDGVVSVEKTKGNVSAPSLDENKIYKTIAKKTGLSMDAVKRIIESKNNK